MDSMQPKNVLILDILDILRKYTDADHRLSQAEILDILKNEYDMIADRRSIKRNIQNLIDFGYDINYNETERMTPDKDGILQKNYLQSDFYLEHEFSDSELRLLIDGLLFSKHIPYSQCQELVGKIEGLSNQYFKSRVRYIKALPDNKPDNKQLFYTIEILDEAILKGRQVSFHYNHFAADKKMHPAVDSNGKPKEYIINPYQIAATNGRYYLICNYDKYDSISNYRIDRITDIKLLDIPIKPQKEVKGLQNGLNLPKHMVEHIYMFAGESIPVTFRAKKYLLDDIMDWFGSDIVISDESDDEITVRVTVNDEAMRRWALQYALHIKILSPVSLANQLKEDLQTALKYYDE